MKRLGLTTSPLSLLGAALLLIVAGVHFQQYVDFMSEVPTIGVLFLLNGAGGAGLAVALLSRDGLLRLLAAAGGIALAVGSLISIIISLESSLFGYSEPTLRFAILVAIIAEALAIPVLAMIATTELRAFWSSRSAAPVASPAT